MRKIKFRALAVVNDKRNGIKVGDFVFGQYIESGVDAPCIVFGDGEQIEVDRKTLGQFIDINIGGVEFYEGDIYVGNYGGGPQVVEFKVAKVSNTYGHGDHGTDRTSGFCISGYYGNEFKVVGNIHQNPELMERQS